MRRNTGSSRPSRAKIAQIIYTGFGGLGSVAFSLIEADKDRSHDWITGFIGDVAIEPSYVHRCRTNGVAWAAFRSKAGWPFGAWRSLARWLDSQRPDAIILHSINSVLACKWYCWRHGKPLIVVEHTPNAVKPRSEKFASIIAMILADTIVVLTRDYASELARAQRWLYRANKISIIPNGIDTAVFSPPVARSSPKSRAVLGMAARFSFSKRQELLIGMMMLLRQERPQIDWQLRLAGDGGTLEEIKRLVHQNRLGDHVIFDGLLPEHAVAEWLRGLDFYTHASNGETLSTSLLQAMATGLPVIASDIPGIRNLLGTASPLGKLVSNDPQAFARGAIELADDSLLRERFQGAARRHCEQHHSNQIMLERYLALLDQHSVPERPGKRP